jgi:hypothetical protein
MPVLPDPTLPILPLHALSVQESRTRSFTEPQDQRAGCATPDRGPDTPANLDNYESMSLNPSWATSSRAKLRLVIRLT